MITLIRKNQKTLLIIITVLVIIAFAWLYNGTQFDKIGINNIGSIYGQTLTRTDVERRARLFELAASLGLFDLLSTLGGQAANRDQAVQAFIFHSMVLEHEAEALQIRPGDAQVADVIRELPVFQTNGKFDLKRYSRFVERTLAPNGLTENQLEQVVRAKLKLERLMELLGAATVTSPREVRAAWEQRNRQYSTSIVRFPLERFAARVEPTDKQIAEFYEQRKQSLTTAEKRRVSVVRFSLGEEQSALEGTARIKALQQVANQAGQFTQDVLDPEVDFFELAGEYGLEVESHGPFAAGEPPPALSEVDGFAEAAFSLTEQLPTSDAVQVDNGFLVLHLDEVVPSRQMTLDEARGEIIATIKRERGLELAAAEASAARSKLLASMQGGAESFAQAAQRHGLQAESLATFSLADPSLDSPEAGQILQLATGMGAGETSTFTSTPDGGFILHVDEVALPDDSQFASERERIARALENRKRQVAFYQWLSNRLDAANVEGV